MTKEEIRILLSKYQAGTLSDEERAILESWYLSTVKNASVTISDQDLQFNLKAVEKVIISGTRPGRPSSRSLWVSAALILLIGTGLLFVVSKKVKPESVKEEIVYVAPGRDQATLKLSNGKTIDLNGEKKGIIVTNKEVVYNDGSKVEETESAYFELSTPKGGQYHVVLPDGTKVWLNAASSLRYPQKFNDKERKVFLDGEAYFEVKYQNLNKSGASEFVVHTKNQEIKVLGTTFNVMDYSDEFQYVTTLINGKVNVFAKSTGEQMSLSPGQESYLDDAVFKTRQADVSSAIGWKEGVFRFNDLELKIVMKQLSRWYNIDVEFHRGVSDTYIYGIINRNRPLSAILDVLKEADVHFKLIKIGMNTKLIILP